jgi:hypothetical protein
MTACLYPLHPAMLLVLYYLEYLALERAEFVEWQLGIERPTRL